MTGCGGASDEQIAARVGDAVMLRQNLQSAYGLPDQAADSAAIQAWENAARDWALKEILLREAEKRGLEQDSLFRARLENLRKELLIRLLYEQMARPGAVDSAEVVAEYNENLREFVTGADQMDLLYIQAGTRELANRVRRDLQSGVELMSILAQDESLRGQDLGWVEYTELSPEIAKAAWTLVPGGISYPLKHEPGGYIVLQCRQRRSQGTILPLEEVYEEIRDRVKQRGQSEAEKALRDSLWAVYKPEISLGVAGQ